MSLSPLPAGAAPSEPAGGGMSARRPPAPLSVAPMMDVTDRHLRYMLRLLSRRTLLYSEMVTARAVIRGDRQKLLAFHPAERPLALQLGGDDPALAVVAHDHLARAQWLLAAHGSNR